MATYFSMREAPRNYQNKVIHAWICALDIADVPLYNLFTDAAPLSDSRRSSCSFHFRSARTSGASSNCATAPPQRPCAREAEGIHGGRHRQWNRDQDR